MPRILSSLAVAFILVLGIAACTTEEEGARASCGGIPPERNDAVIIATGILTRQSHELIFDSEELADLSSQIEHSLRLIRDAYPATAHIRAYESFPAGQLLMGVESPLKEAIQDAVGSQWGSRPPAATGQAAFDALNASLGLWGIQISYGFDQIGLILLCLDDRVNVPAAAAAYSELDGVRSAGSNSFAWADGRPPDVDALQDGDTWYFVFDGRPPLMYFTVTGDTVTGVEASQAATDPRFASLVELVKY